MKTQVSPEVPPLHQKMAAVRQAARTASLNTLML